MIHEQNIVLKSKGDAKCAFCYISDVLSGLMYILFNGENGEAYNLANEKEEVSIRDLAEILIQMSPNINLRVEYDIPQSQSSLYCNYKRIGLDTSKLESLGWQPKISLKEGLNKMLDDSLC